jgi:Domain of unknown function (DUF4169)
VSDVLPAQDGGMGEIVNLRRVKKHHARDADATAAKQNRIRHGRTRIDKENDRREEQRREALLDASHRGEMRE